MPIIQQPTYEDQLRAEQDIINNYGGFQNALTVARNIADAKAAYANAAGDMQKQTSANESANIWREYAKKNGIDTSNIDNMNANQANAYVKTLENEARQKYLYRDTPEQMNAKAIQNYLKQGIKEKDAIRMAYYDTLPYAAQYAAEGKMLFGDRGTTNNAVNTNYGVPLMMLLSDTAPEVAQIAAATNALPKDNWTADQKIRQMFTAGDIASGQSAQQYNQNLGLLGARIAGQRQLQGDAHNYKMDEMALSANLDMQALQNRISAMSAAERERYNYLDTALKDNFGITDPQLRAMLIFGFNGGQNNGGNSRGSSGDNGANDNQIAIRAAQSKEAAQNALDEINFKNKPREAANLILKAEEFRPILQNANIPKNILEEFEKRQTDLKNAFKSKYGADYTEALKAPNFKGGNEYE